MLPLDLNLGARNGQKSMLYLQARFTEDSGCLELPESNRAFRIQIVQVIEKEDGTTLPPDTLAESMIRGYNPTCAKSSDFHLDHGDFRFECKFSGSFTQFSFR